MLIPIDAIGPNPEQPRREFDQAELESLAQSIRLHGVIQAITVEDGGESYYVVVDGERRLRAAKMAGLTQINADVRRSHPMRERLVDALVANIQRADLNPIEEAQAMLRLKSELKWADLKIARELGVSYARVSSRLKLLELDAPIQAMIASGKLSKDDRLTEALMTLPAGEIRVGMAQALVEKNMTIRAGIKACSRMAEHLEALPGATDSMESPAMRYATKAVGMPNLPAWNVFAQAGQVPQWPVVKTCAERVCDNCALRETASATTCAGCALVEMVMGLIRMVQQ